MDLTGMFLTTCIVLHAKVPPGHVEHDVLPRLLNCPLEHEVHEAKLPAPEPAENVSRGHCKHVETSAAPRVAE